MDAASHNRTAKQGQGQFLALGLMALVAVVAGLILPQLLPSTDSGVPPTVSISNAAKGSAKGDKNDLTYVPPAWPEPPNHQAVFLRLGLGTISVLALCAATLWGCKRWLRGDPLPATAGAQMRCLETLALGNRCTVHLVHVGSKPVLIGADAGGIKTIVPLPESFAQALDGVVETANAGT